VELAIKKSKLAKKCKNKRSQNAELGKFELRKLDCISIEAGIVTRDKKGYGE